MSLIPGAVGTVTTLTDGATVPSGKTLSLPGSVSFDGSGNYSNPNIHRFSAFLSANVTGVANNTFTDVVFNTENYDVGGFYDNTNGRFTPAANTIWLLSAGIVIQSNAVDTLSEAISSLYKNGSIVQLGTYIKLQATPKADLMSVTLNVTIVGNGTDFYTVRGRGTAGTNITFSTAGNNGTYISGVRIG